LSDTRGSDFPTGHLSKQIVFESGLGQYSTNLAVSETVVIPYMESSFVEQDVGKEERSKFLRVEITAYEIE
jgi:hypothetical protein